MDCKYPLDCIKIIKQKLPIVRTFYIRAVGNFIKIKNNYFQFLSHIIISDAHPYILSVH